MVMGLEKMGWGRGGYMGRWRPEARGLEQGMGLAPSRWEVFLGRLGCRQRHYALGRQVVNI